MFYVAYQETCYNSYYFRRRHNWFAIATQPFKNDAGEPILRGMAKQLDPLCTVFALGKYETIERARRAIRLFDRQKKHTEVSRDAYNIVEWHHYERSFEPDEDFEYALNVGGDEDDDQRFIGVG